MILKLDNETLTVHLLCERCGVEWSIHRRTYDRGNADLVFCSSCNATPWQICSYGPLGYCKPWHGDFDEFDNPMLNGEYYRPGSRTCGHRDCVEPSHVIPAAVEVSPPNPSPGT